MGGHKRLVAATVRALTARIGLHRAQISTYVLLIRIVHPVINDSAVTEQLLHINYLRNNGCGTKKSFFELALLSPGDWYIQALDLKAAADRLDYTKFPVRQYEDVINYIGTYQLLLGFSFENLLKGLIIFFRMRSGEIPSLTQKHFTHDLSALAGDPSCAPLEITSDELATLHRLSAYGIWAGRYPMPKRAADVTVISHGSREYAAEQALWNRLSK